MPHTRHLGMGAVACPASEPGAPWPTRQRMPEVAPSVRPQITLPGDLERASASAEMRPVRSTRHLAEIHGPP